MRITPTLSNLDNLDADALVVFLPGPNLPLLGFLGLLDWRMCFGFSNFILKSKKLFSQSPILIADYKNLKFGKIFTFVCNEELVSKQQLDSKILQAFKVLSKADIGKFVISFPDNQPWIFDHWEKNYENHAMFKNIAVIDRYAGFN